MTAIVNTVSLLIPSLQAFCWIGILMTMAAPTADALTIGPTIIRACPGCSQPLRQFTIGSGNTIGARVWTDGCIHAPMLPMMAQLVKCPRCKALYWVEDAKELGRITYSSSENEWKDAELPLEADEHDYLVAAASVHVSRAHELHARQRAWWLANDPVREDPTKKVEWTDARKKNLERLSTLFEGGDDCQLTWKGEIARELHQFDLCLDLLKRPMSGQWSCTAELVIGLAKRKNAQVEELPTCK